MTGKGIFSKMPTVISLPFINSSTNISSSYSPAFFKAGPSSSSFRTIETPIVDPSLDGSILSKSPVESQKGTFDLFLDQFFYNALPYIDGHHRISLFSQSFQNGLSGLHGDFSLPRQTPHHHSDPFFLEGGFLHF